jgi:hypothetical protein
MAEEFMPTPIFRRRRVISILFRGATMTDSLSGFKVFRSAVLTTLKNEREGREETPPLTEEEKAVNELIEDSGSFDYASTEVLWKLFQDAAVFEIDESVKKLLLLTNPPEDLDKKLLRLPFDNIFLSVCFQKEDGLEEDVMGVLVMNPKESPTRELGLINAMEEVITGEPWVHFWNGVSCSHDDVHGLYWLNSHTWVVERDEKKVGIRVVKDKQKQHERLKHFITNFLLFLNQPDVEYRLVRRSSVNRDRALSRGKMPLPDTVHIKVKGELKVYIDRMERQGFLHAGYSHKFWVRGHWRHFEGEHFKNKKGQRRWIMPFVKGEGILVKKDYVMEGNNG